MKKRLTIIIEQGEDGYLIAEVVELPGCRTQARTQQQLLERIKEAIELHLEAYPQEVKERFLGIKHIEVEV